MPDNRRAWASALFASAPDAERRRAYAEALEALSQTLSGAEGRALRDILRDPDVSKDRKAGLLASACPPPADGAAEDPLFGRFCGLVVRKGRSGLLPAIAIAYRALLDRAENSCPLEIEAAREVSPETVARLAEAWKKATGAASVRASIRIRPELAGGYRLRSGSVRLDYSIAGRARRLGLELARASVSREEG